MRHAMLFVMLVTAATLLVAQDSGPSEPTDTEILIPELLLEVEELTVEQVDALLPAEGDLALGEIQLPQPRAEDLTIDDSAFEVRPPLQTTSGGATSGSVFSSGRLGAGSVHHVLGELSLFKLGESPRFRLEFAHEGLDGYQFNEAGTGYFDYTNVVQGWLQRTNDTTSLDVTGSFEERAEGMQGQSAYYSVGTRETSALTEFDWSPDPLVVLSGNLDATVTSRILSASGTGPVPREQEYTLTPEIGVRASISALDLLAKSSYMLRFLAAGEIPIHQDIDLMAGFDLTLPSSLTVNGRAGIFYTFGDRLDYPWSLSIQAVLGEAFETSLTGGYTVRRYRLADLWSETMLLAPGDSDGTSDLVNNRIWYGEFDGRWSWAGGFTLGGEVRFSSESAAIDIEGFDGATANYSFVQRPGNFLTTVGRIGWQPSPQFQVQAAWTGSFIDLVTGVPANGVEGSIQVSDSSQRFEGTVEVKTAFYPNPVLPLLGVTGAFNASEGVEFVLEVDDILSPFLTTVGRPVIGSEVNADFPFISPGLRASLYAQISL